MLKIIILLTLGLCLFAFQLEKQNCKIINKQKYCINENSNSSKFTTLETIDKKFEKIINYLQEKYPDKEITKALTDRYKNKTKMSELLNKDKHIAFSKNKGEEVSLCLEDENIDLNVLMFIAIHELSHIGTDEIGHTDKFWKNMKFLLEVAIDYKIESSPLYD